MMMTMKMITENRNISIHYYSTAKQSVFEGGAGVKMSQTHKQSIIVLTASIVLIIIMSINPHYHRIKIKLKVRSWVCE